MSRPTDPRTVRSVLAAAVTSLALVAPTVSAASARGVGCGESFAGDGSLRASCVGNIVVRGGTLNLAGHTIWGSVQCDGEFCEIYSDPPNGRVSGSGQVGSVGIRAGAGAADTGGSLAIDDVIVSGFTTGVAAGNVRVSDSLVGGNLGYGVDAYFSIEASNAIVSVNGGGGLHARIGGVSVDRTLVTDNGGNGIRALEGVIVTGSTISDNAGDGVQNFSGPAMVVDSSITANGGHGVRTDDSDCFPADVLELVGATVTGNGIGTDCGESRACADLVACAVPVLAGGTRCGTSYRMTSGLPGESWAACDQD